MENLFKFVLVRPAVAQATDTPSISLAQNTPFQAALAAAKTGQSVSDDMKRAAAQLTSASDVFVADVSALHLGAGLARLASSLNGLEQTAGTVAVALRSAITSAMGADAATTVASADYAADTRRLRDSILAIKLLPEQHGLPLLALVNCLRDLDLIARAASDPHFPASGSDLRRYRNRSLALPPLFPLSSVLAAAGSSSPTGTADDDRRKAITSAFNRHVALTSVLRELNALDGGSLRRTAPQPSVAALTPVTLRPLALFEQAVKQGWAPSVPIVRLTATFANTDTGAPPAGIPPDKSLPPTPLSIISTVGSPLQAIRSTLNSRLAFRPPDPAIVPFALTAQAAAALSEKAQVTLAQEKLDVQTRPLDTVVDSLRASIRQTVADLDQLQGRAVQQNFQRVAGRWLVVSTPLVSAWAGVSIDPGLGTTPNPLPPPGVPHTHGSVNAAGVADLILVKQQLVRYEATDIAHIENVMQGEKMARNYKRRTLTEQVTVRETESTTSEERQLQTTDRFEMTRETNQTIQEQAALKAGLTLSGAYGPTVDFSASAEGSLSRNKEESTKSAATFSQQTTQTATSKITERVLQRVSLSVTTEVLETNDHGFDNVQGQAHIRGIYQWVEKVYEAQMFNYGIRTMYDFTVAEPAAFLIEALRRGHVNATQLDKPIQFTLQADQITEYNYHFWVLQYGATDVGPPPEPFVTKTFDFSAGGGDDKTDYEHSGQITIDEGYRAIYASVGVTGNTWDDQASVDLVIGQRGNRIENAGVQVWHTSLDNEIGSIAVALNTFHQSDVAIAIEVRCQRTDRATDKWRQDTHAKLITAYRARLAEYQEKLDELQAAAGVEIKGFSPFSNLAIMNEEIKKACISIITDQHFDTFNAVENGLDGLPQINLAENAAEGPYVRFLEQAFEWEHMTWLTYPYFWGRKSQWVDRLVYDDTDPLFNQFLKAGFCRVVVPARPGFEGAIDHFMTIGDLWMGGPLPPISSPLYLPIADELAERLDRPGGEIPQGDPWLVRVPTNLVRLRDGGSLPVWHKDADGNWMGE